MKFKNALITSVLALSFGFMAISRHNAESLSNRVSLAANEHSQNVTDSAGEYDEAGENTEKKAEAIALAVTEIDTIERASVILTGNSAIVGIEIKGSLSDAKLIELKKKAEQKARETDKTLEHVAVTAGAELIKRIDKIADYSTKNAESGLNEEQEEIVDSLTPVL